MRLVRKIKLPLGSLLRHDVLGTTGSPYMERRYLQTPWFTLRLHQIHRSDAGRALHDHPWWFLSLVLSGGYRETTPDGVREVRAPALVFHRATDLHRLELPEGASATTLVLTGPRTRAWGFQLADRWVPHRDYRGAA